MNPTTYPIRTLADIYNLPTIEQVETCLREMAVAILTSRATDDSTIRALRETGIEIEGRAFAWPETVDWVDDGRGEVGFSVLTPDGVEIVSSSNIEP